jgi:hypothetical protein
MNNKPFKIGDRVKIINASSIELCELNKVGVVVKIENCDGGSWITYIVDMGRPRRPGHEEDTETCWWLNEGHIELACKPNEQLLFPFMKE